PLRGVNRKRAPEHALHQAEDRRIGSDAQRKREHGNGSECWRVAQLTHRVAHIGAELIEQPNASSLAGVFLDALDAAKFEPRLPLCLLARPTSAHEIVCI